MTNIDEQINNRKTCKELIEERLADREEYMNGLLDAIDSDEEFDGYSDPMDAMYDYALGYDKVLVVNIQISAGGPADWLEVFVAPEKNPEILKIKYHYSDWFDHAEMTVDSDSPFYRYAETMIEGLLY